MIAWAQKVIAIFMLSTSAMSVACLKIMATNIQCHRKMCTSNDSVLRNQPFTNEQPDGSSVAVINVFDPDMNRPTQTNWLVEISTRFKCKIMRKKKFVYS